MGVVNKDEQLAFLDKQERVTRGMLKHPALKEGQGPKVRAEWERDLEIIEALKGVVRDGNKADGRT